jgi:Zn finger protein HypA/HybF involved in hydrogenase expression
VRVRCGSCRSEVEIPGPGRFNCPSCGSPNEVRDPAAGSPAGMPPGGGLATPPTPPPAPPPEPPSPKIACGECEFSFIVGDIDLATCPNCGAEVAVGRGDSSG